MATALVHIRRLILIFAVVYFSGVVCEDLTFSLYPRPSAGSGIVVRGKGRLSSLYFEGGASGVGATTASNSAGENTEPIEIPRKFHLQLWIYIYSFVIYAVLVDLTVL